MDLSRYQHLLKDRLDLGQYATFVPNKHSPVYNWFYYKEGFSKELVDLALDMFQPASVLDPFCGSGTVLLACKQRSINAVGVDSMPISVFSSVVKTTDYDAERLMDIRKDLLSSRFQKLKCRFPHFFHRYFSKYVMDDIAFFLVQLEGVKEPAKSFFLLALINAAVRSSWAFKDGAMLKLRKQGNIPMRKMFSRITEKMLHDLRGFEAKPCEIEVKQGDARMLEMPDDCVDAVITSPPYLNNIDYTKVYSIENWFVGQSEPQLRSFIGMQADVENDIGLELPPSANAYFKDMQLALKEMHRVLKPCGKAAIVVGNAYFLDMDMIVDSDLILSALAEELGFCVSEILVLNKRYALEHRTIKKGVLRESMIVMEKA